jgi:kynureninase
MPEITEIRYARDLDARDPLAPYRDVFVIEDPDLIYLDGNSLGRLPKATVEMLDQLVRKQWGDRLIRGWNEHWYIQLQTRIGDKIGRLVGAAPGEVLVVGETSNNLFKLVVAALRMRPGRTTILTDDLNFPSDHYIFQGVCRLLGPDYSIKVIPSSDGIHGPVEALEAAVDENTALVSLSHTAFKSAFVYPMERLTAAAHQAGALMLWDLSHSVGALPLELNGANADMAVGCTYKYLNGGPGAPAFAYVRTDLQPQVDNPISGWMGQRAPFDFELKYQPAEGMRRLMTGTPTVLSIAAIEPGVDMFLEAGIERIRQKSLAQTEYFIRLWKAWLQPRGYLLNSPINSAQRGSHISLAHAEGFGIDQALIHSMNVLPDFRPPDIIRFGFAPLYTRYEDLYLAAEGLARIVDDRLFEKYRGTEKEVV